MPANETDLVDLLADLDLRHPTGQNYLISVEEMSRIKKHLRHKLRVETGQPEPAIRQPTPMPPRSHKFQ